MPTILRKQIVNWHHTYIIHTGIDRTEATISQHYYWTNSGGDILTHTKVCRNSLDKNKQGLKYGRLRAKEAEAIPWDILLVALIGSYKIITEFHYDSLMLKTLTIIDSETR